MPGRRRAPRPSIGRTAGSSAPARTPRELSAEPEQLVPERHACRIDRAIALLKPGRDLDIGRRELGRRIRRVLDDRQHELCGIDQQRWNRSWSARSPGSRSARRGRPAPPSSSARCARYQLRYGSPRRTSLGAERADRYRPCGEIATSLTSVLPTSSTATASVWTTSASFSRPCGASGSALFDRKDHRDARGKLRLTRRDRDVRGHRLGPHHRARRRREEPASSTEIISPSSTPAAAA